MIKRAEAFDLALEESEYVMIENDNAAMPYDGTLVLSTANKKIKFQKDVVEVGRDDDCDYMILHNEICRRHATFYYEKNAWFLRDNFSINGTYINGVRLQSGKKYQLTAHDEISFAKKDKVIFYKCEALSHKIADSKDKASRILSFLEAGMTIFAKSMFKDEVAYKLILATLSEAPLYFPVDIDVVSVAGTIDMTNLSEGVLTKKEDIKIKNRMVTLEDEAEMIPAFTSEEEARKGGATSLIRYYPKDYLPIITKIGKPAIINPFSENRFLMAYKFLTDTLVPIVRNKRQSSEPFGRNYTGQSRYVR